MKEIRVAVISPESVGGITKMFLEEKCFQRRTGTSDYNFVTCNMMTCKITSFDVYVPTTKKVWITPRVLDADAYLFAYDSRVPQSLERLWYGLSAKRSSGANVRARLTMSPPRDTGISCRNSSRKRDTVGFPVLSARCTTARNTAFFHL